MPLNTCTVFLVRTKDGSLLPTLVVDVPGGSPRVVPEVVGFVQSQANRGESLVKLRSMVTLLGLLHDFVTTSYCDRSVEPEGLPDIIAAFLRMRRKGASFEEDGLDLEPVKRETVERDCHYLRLFSEFCADRYGHFPLVPTASSEFGMGGRSYREVMRRLSRNRRMLLAHVAGRSAPSPVPLVGIGERTVKRRSNGQTHMPKAMIEDLILGTTSVTQRMAFILAAFGGPRISEILNLWRCDVLPGHLRPVLFPDDVASEVPLVVLAHPSQSRYVGETRPGRADRLQYLASTHALRPRNLLEGDSMEAGWKGMLLDNEGLLISQVFWADRSWGKVFYDLHGQVRDRLLSSVPESVRKGHPYLIVNDAPGRPEYGQPMKMSNVRKAFDRAVLRLGVRAERHHQGIHGLRHSYKAMLEKLGMSDEEVRKSMHHVSVASQASYAQSAGRLNERLSLLLGNGEAA